MDAPTRSPPAAGDPPPPAPPTFDQDRLTAEMGDLSPLRQIALDALHDFPRFLEHMRRSAAASRYESLACFARRLAMLCTSLMAPEVAKSASALQYASEAADDERIAACLPKLEEQLMDLVRDLAEACDIVI